MKMENIIFSIHLEDPLISGKIDSSIISGVHSHKNIGMINRQHLQQAGIYLKK